MNCIKCLWEPAQSSGNVSSVNYPRQVGQGSLTGLRGGLTLGSTARALEAVVASQLLSPAGQAQRTLPDQKRLSAALHATSVHARQHDHGVLGRCPTCRSCPRNLGSYGPCATLFGACADKVGCFLKLCPVISKWSLRQMCC